MKRQKFRILLGLLLIAVFFFGFLFAMMFSANFSHSGLNQNAPMKAGAADVTGKPLTFTIKDMDEMGKKAINFHPTGGWDKEGIIYVTIKFSSKVYYAIKYGELNHMKIQLYSTSAGNTDARSLRVYDYDNSCYDKTTSGKYYATDDKKGDAAWNPVLEFDFGSDKSHLKNQTTYYEMKLEIWAKGHYDLDTTFTSVDIYASAKNETAPTITPQSGFNFNNATNITTPSFTITDNDAGLWKYEITQSDADGMSKTYSAGEKTETIAFDLTKFKRSSNPITITVYNNLNNQKSEVFYLTHKVNISRYTNGSNSATGGTLNVGDSAVASPYTGQTSGTSYKLKGTANEGYYLEGYRKGNGSGSESTYDPAQATKTYTISDDDVKTATLNFYVSFRSINTSSWTTSYPYTGAPIKWEDLNSAPTLGITDSEFKFRYTYLDASGNTISAPTNVGSYKIKIEVYYKTTSDIRGSKTLDISITKATPKITSLSVTDEHIYGEDLSVWTEFAGTVVNPNSADGALAVAGEFDWVSTDGIIPGVNNTGYAVVFRPSDTANYNAETTIFVKDGSEVEATAKPPVKARAVLLTWVGCNGSYTDFNSYVYNGEWISPTVILRTEEWITERYTESSNLFHKHGLVGSDDVRVVIEIFKEGELYDENVERYTHAGSYVAKAASLEGDQADNYTLEGALSTNATDPVVEKPFQVDKKQFGQDVQGRMIGISNSSGEFSWTYDGNTYALSFDLNLLQNATGKYDQLTVVWEIDNEVFTGEGTPSFRNVKYDETLNRVSAYSVTATFSHPDYVAQKDNVGVEERREFQKTCTVTIEQAKLSDDYFTFSGLEEGSNRETVQYDGKGHRITVENATETAQHDLLGESAGAFVWKWYLDDNRTSLTGDRIGYRTQDGYNERGDLLTDPNAAWTYEENVVNVLRVNTYASDYKFKLAVDSVDHNYEKWTKEVLLRIEPRTVHVDFKDLTIYYGDEGTIEDRVELVFKDGTTPVEGEQIQITPNVSVGSHYSVGEHTIYYNPGANDNYDITTTSFKITVLSRSVTVTTQINYKTQINDPEKDKAILLYGEKPRDLSAFFSYTVARVKYMDKEGRIVDARDGAYYYEDGRELTGDALTEFLALIAKIGNDPIVDDLSLVPDHLFDTARFWESYQVVATEKNDVYYKNQKATTLYEIEFIPARLQISPRPVYVSLREGVNLGEVEYGHAPNEIQSTDLIPEAGTVGSGKGLMPGDEIATHVEFDASNHVQKDASGKYIETTVSATGSDAKGNYSVTIEAITFTVIPAKVVVALKETALTTPYGTLAKPELIFSGLIEGDLPEEIFEFFDGFIDVPAQFASVGSYEFYISKDNLPKLKDRDGEPNFDYELVLSEESSKGIITIAAIEVPELTFTGAETSFTGEELPLEGVSYYTISGIENGSMPNGKVSYLYWIDGEWSEAAPLHAGHYRVKLVYEPAERDDYCATERESVAEYEIKPIAVGLAFNVSGEDEVKDGDYETVEKQYTSDAIVISENIEDIFTLVKVESGIALGSVKIEYSSDGVTFDETAPTHYIKEGYYVRLTYLPAEGDDYVETEKVFYDEEKPALRITKYVLSLPFVRYSREYNQVSVTEEELTEKFTYAVYGIGNDSNKRIDGTVTFDLLEAEMCMPGSYDVRVTFTTEEDSDYEGGTRTLTGGVVITKSAGSMSIKWAGELEESNNYELDYTAALVDDEALLEACFQVSDSFSGGESRPFDAYPGKFELRYARVGATSFVSGARDAGTYRIQVRYISGGAEDVYETRTFTIEGELYGEHYLIINPIAPTVNVSVGRNLTYNGRQQRASYTLSGVGGVGDRPNGNVTLEYAKKTNDTPVTDVEWQSLNGTMDFSSSAPYEAGEYYVRYTYTPSTTDNYSRIENRVAPIVMVIAQASATLSVPVQRYEYDGRDKPYDTTKITVRGVNNEILTQENGLESFFIMYRDLRGTWSQVDIPNQSGTYDLQISATLHNPNYVNEIPQQVFTGVLIINNIKPGIEMPKSSSGQYEYVVEYTGNEVSLPQATVGNNNDAKGEKVYEYNVNGVWVKTAPKDVGEYSVRVRYVPTADDNYSADQREFRNYLKIVALELTVDPHDAQGKEYDGVKPEGIGYVFRNKAGVEVSLVAGNPLTGALSAGDSADEGEYEITIGSLNAGKNYVLKMGEEKEYYTIRAKLLTVRFSEIDPTYDGTAKTVSYELIGVLEKDLDSVTTVLRYTTVIDETGKPVFSGDVGAPSDAGIFYVQLALTSSNYILTETGTEEEQKTITKKYEITPAQLSGVTLPSASFYYDGEAHRLTPSWTNGTPIGDADGLVITPLSGTSYVEPGSYVIRIRINASRNYYALELQSELTILKAIPNVTVFCEVSPLRYGDPLPRLGTNADGTATLLNPQQLLPGEREYAWIFVPSDEVHYQRVEGKITLTVEKAQANLSVDGALNRTTDNPGRIQGMVDAPEGEGVVSVYYTTENGTVLNAMPTTPGKYRVVVVYSGSEYYAPSERVEILVIEKPLDLTFLWIALGVLAALAMAGGLFVWAKRRKY